MTAHDEWQRAHEHADRSHDHAEGFAQQAALHLLRVALLSGVLPTLVARTLYEWEAYRSLNMLPDLAAALRDTAAGAPLDAAGAPLDAARVALRECARKQYESTEERLRKAARLREVGVACVTAAATMAAANRAVVWRRGEAARVCDVVRSGKTFIEVRPVGASPDAPVERITQVRGGWPDGVEVHRLGDAPTLRVSR